MPYRIVAEQREMTRPTAGGNACTHRVGQAEHGTGSQLVEVGSPGSLQLALARLGMRQPSQTVNDYQDDASILSDGEAGDNFRSDCAHDVAPSNGSAAPP